MSTKTRLPLWVFASAAKHFTDNISGLHVFIEGQERTTIDESDWCEIRIDGPWIREVSRNVLVVTCEINVLVGTVIDSTNLYKESMNHTLVMPALSDFCVYKFGPEVEDDSTLLGTMMIQPIRDMAERIEIARFGQINPAIPLLQSTIEGHFKMTLFV